MRKLYNFPDANIDRQIVEIVNGAEPKNANIQTHIADIANPHGVTALQVGAVPALAPVTVNAACTDLPTAVALVNQLRGVMIANGQCI